MTASELKYLIATERLKGDGGAKMAAVAKSLGVSKVSVCRAVERLVASGYIEQTNKKIVLTEKGRAETAEYLQVAEFIGGKLERFCHTPKDTAFDEGVVAACALGEISRGGVLALVKNGGTE